MQPWLQRRHVPPREIIMISNALWLFMAGPLALISLAALPNGTANRSPLRIAGLVRGLSLATLGSAIVALAAVLLDGPMHTPTDVPGLGLWLDPLSAIMFVLVSFVGTIVASYSRNYLAGDAGQGRFTRLLGITLGAVLTLIIAGNMVQFLAAWVLTSIGLNKLLLFYNDRPAAILAARKKFIASRIGDLALIGAAWAIFQQFGGLDYGTIFAGAKALAGAELPAGIAAAAGLIVLAGLLKSAQFPTHGWLLEVMETPTPVSALLHAGIINAGGFVLLRYSDIVGLSATSMDALALVGGFTAIFGSVVMLTQNSIKVSLAYSTVAQMGFMMLQCGLGAWPAALLHILAHSLYKAHAFLSSGSVIDIARASWSPSPGGQLHPSRLMFAVPLVLAAAFAVGTLFGFQPMAQPGVFAFSAIMTLGLTHFIAQSIDERPTAYVIIRVIALAVLVAAGYFALQAGMAALMAGTLAPNAGLRGPLTAGIALAVVGGFALLTIMQSTLVAARSGSTPEWLRAFYVHAHNGLYVNTFANRLVLKIWPTGIPSRR
jgi:NAD(P)H-quinone oxidoreductase subunit 5